jgi:hypothetical protein
MGSNADPAVLGLAPWYLSLVYSSRAKSPRTNVALHLSYSFYPPIDSVNTHFGFAAQPPLTMHRIRALEIEP